MVGGLLFALSIAPLAAALGCLVARRPRISEALNLTASAISLACALPLPFLVDGLQTLFWDDYVIIDRVSAWVILTRMASRRCSTAPSLACGAGPRSTPTRATTKRAAEKRFGPAAWFRASPGAASRAPSPWPPPLGRRADLQPPRRVPPALDPLGAPRRRPSRFSPARLHRRPATPAHPRTGVMKASLSRPLSETMR